MLDFRDYYCQNVHGSLSLHRLTKHHDVDSDDSVDNRFDDKSVEQY